MSRFRNALTACAVALPLIASGADASVFFEFRQTSATPADNDLQLTGWIAISDAAFASGIGPFWAGSDSDPINWAAVGIEGLYFAVDPPHSYLQVGLADLVPQPLPGEPGHLIMWGLDVQSDPGGAPDVRFWFGDSESSFDWQMGAAGAVVSFATDLTAPCISDACYIYGEFVRVPEPATARLLLVGLVALYSTGGIRRRPHPQRAIPTTPG